MPARTKTHPAEVQLRTHIYPDKFGGQAVVLFKQENVTAYVNLVVQTVSFDTV